MQDVADIIRQAAGQAFGSKVDPEVEYAEAKFGDFTTNLPFKLAGALKRDPRELAAELAAAIKDDQVEAAEAAGAGFVNLTMSDIYWAHQLSKVGPDFGAGKGRQKVQVEFVSANPTGPLTLGNARGGFIGDTLARVLEHRGYQVTREYYFNDAGSQITKLVESVKAAVGLVHPEEVQYKGAYIDELADEFRAELEQLSDSELGKKLTQSIFRRYLEPAVKRMGVKFDVWFNERELVETGQFDSAVERLKAVGLYFEQDGAKWVRTSELGDERDRPIVKSNGDITYLGNDIAYHLNIFERREFDWAIKEWGADHAGQVPSLKLTMHRLAPEKRLDFVIHQFVRLMREGKEVKMSKRAGTFVTVDDLLDDVPADVARFFFLMRSADSHMDFDMDLAREESQKNPYWYVMYASARAHSILRQAKDKGLEPSSRISALSKPARRLVLEVSRFPRLLEEIEQDFGVHRLTFYGLELARAFHDLYEERRIITLPKDEAEPLLYLLQQFCELIKLYSRVLGIQPVEKM